MARQRITTDDAVGEVHHLALEIDAEAIRYQPGDALGVYSERRGLPQALLDSLPREQCLRIPMLQDSRSLNLSNAAALFVYEAWRQQGFAGAMV